MVDLWQATNFPENILAVADKIENLTLLNAQERALAAACLRIGGKTIGKKTSGHRGAPRVHIPRDFFVLFHIYFESRAKEQGIFDTPGLIELRTVLVNYFAKEYGVTNKAIEYELKKYGWDFSKGKFNKPKRHGYTIDCTPILESKKELEAYHHEQEKTSTSQRKTTREIADKFEKNCSVNTLECTWAVAILRGVSKGIKDGLLDWHDDRSTKIPKFFYSLFMVEFYGSCKRECVSDERERSKLRANLVKRYSELYQVTPRAINKALKYEMDYSK